MLLKDDSGQHVAVTARHSRQLLIQYLYPSLGQANASKTRIPNHPPLALCDLHAFRCRVRERSETPEDVKTGPTMEVSYGRSISALLLFPRTRREAPTRKSPLACGRQRRPPICRGRQVSQPQARPDRPKRASTTSPITTQSLWGTGTRFGRVSSPIASSLGQAGGQWAKGALHGKVGGAFASSATRYDGHETTLFTIITNLLHFGMTVVGLNYGFTGQMKVDEITGDAPYGATTIDGADVLRQPRETELVGARYQRCAIAETAAILHG